MTSHSDRSGNQVPASPFPSLPILSSDEAKRLSTAEKYGSFFYLGIGGLVLVVSLVAWFGFNVWTLRDLWANVYVLHNASEPATKRIQAAFAIAHDPNANNLQRWEIALERNLPPLARYMVAESLDANTALDDPRRYGLAVSKSEGWPNWLRLLLLRPMVYASAAGEPVLLQAFESLASHPDPVIALWAETGLALRPAPDPELIRRIQTLAETENPNRQLAGLLLDAVHSTTIAQRTANLDKATVWLRKHHKEAAKLWEGYEVVNGRLMTPPS